MHPPVALENLNSGYIISIREKRLNGNFIQEPESVFLLTGSHISLCMPSPSSFGTP